MIIDELLKNEPFILCSNGKKELFQSALFETIQHHLDGSPLYKRWCDLKGFKNVHNTTIDNIPFVPVQVFKERDLLTVNEKDIVDIRHSSGTSSGTPSFVKRDAITLRRYKQSRNVALNNFCPNNGQIQIGIIEDPNKNTNPYLSANLVLSVIADRTGEGKTFYVVSDKDGEPELDIEKFLNILDTYKDNIDLIFGHTAYIYLFLVGMLEKKDIRLHLHNTSMLFGWGWKKYNNKAVSMDIFRAKIERFLGIPSKYIFDMYGFAESNSLYLECSEGFRHVPVWDEVFSRCPYSFKLLASGQEGLLQFLSSIPNSYAGSSVLVDDIGTVFHESVCKCGRKGTRFKVIRRAMQNELNLFKSLSDSFKEVI